MTQETLANYQSARFVSIRRESSETALSEKQDDPDLVQAIESGVNALGPFLSDDLDRLFSKITPPVN